MLSLCISPKNRSVQIGILRENIIRPDILSYIIRIIELDMSSNIIHEYV